MDKYFTVKICSEIPTPEGYLKVLAIHYHKNFYVSEYVFDEEGNEKFVNDYLISKFDCEKYLKAVDGKNHIIFIDESNDELIKMESEYIKNDINILKEVQKK